MHKLLSSGQISYFQLGQNGHSDKFQSSSQLYGREEEVNRLLKCFDRVVLGESKLLLVKGYSGVGKTSLINEMHRPVLLKRGFYLTGNFDQY